MNYAADGDSGHAQGRPVGARALGSAVWFLGMAAVVLQAAALATQYFQPWLDSDYLYPQRFVADLLGGVYPLSGWTLSSSPYFFPDFALAAFWYLVTGGAPVIPFCVVTTYAALALAAGWSLSRTAGEWGGWIAGCVLVNVLLACRAWGDDARWLWWLGTATLHGGAVVMGLVLFALWAGPPERAMPRGRLALGAALLVLGTVSDALFLTQFALPLGAALAIAAGRDWRASPRLRAFAAATAASLAASLALRAATAILHGWTLPRVVRYAPTPSAVARAAGDFLRDAAGPIARNQGALLALFAVGTALALWLSRRHPGPQPAPERRQAVWFAALGLLFTLLLPVAAVYWRNPQHGRYLLPCLVLPLWWLFALGGAASPRVNDRGRPGPRTALLAAAFLLAAVSGLRSLDFGAWRWPYPETAAALDRFVESRGLRVGLADYWHAHTLQTMSRSGLRLTQVNRDGTAQFWDNNAFAHFVVGGDGRLHSPRYCFVVMDGLDPAAVQAAYGAPAERTEVGGLTLWIYDPAAARDLSRRIDRQVRAFVAGRPGADRVAEAPAP